jgi:PAS domain S-box-containing protein
VAASLRRRLQNLGYEVPATISSGEEAIEKAGQLRPNLVLMDIRLEGEMDGVEAGEQIRSRFRIPVVYLTAYSNPEIVSRAKATEPYAYVLKPYDERELHIAIEMALHKHRMERALREREQWLAAILQSMEDGVVATDRAGHITFLNPMAERMTGWTSADAKGRALEEVFQLIQEESRQPIEIPLRQAIQSGTTVTMPSNSVLIGKRGTEALVDDIATPIRDDDGATIGGVMVFRDVTEKRKAQERERQSQRFSQAVLDSLPAPIAVLDREGTITAVNDAWIEFARINGGHSGTGPGTNYLEVCQHASGYGSEGARAAAEGIQGVLDRSASRASLEYACPSGKEESWFLMLAVPLDHGQKAGRGAVIIHVNITDRKKAEMVSSKLSAIVESSDDAIIGRTLDGRITSWNRGAERLFGYLFHEVEGNHFTMLVPPDRIDEAQSLMDRVRKGESVPAFETIRRRKDGKDLEVLVSISPVKDAEGRVVGGAMIIHDISHVKRLEAHIQQAQKMEAIGRLAGGVAHDFNNLLTVINGYTTLLQGVLHQHDRAQELVEEIAKAGDRAARLTQQLLGYGRKQIQQLKVVNLNDLLANSYKMLAYMVGKDVEFVLAPDSALHQIKVDPSQMEQIFMNLAVNARDAMPTGGRLTMETTNVRIEDPHTALLEIPAGNYVLLTITDTGSGMDAKTQAHIFEPFFTTKVFGHGTGLGLATVHGIVRQSGGDIKVTSEQGLGTTFMIYLPSLVEMEVSERAPFEDPKIPGGTETVLVVDDEAAVQKLTHSLLKHCGYKVYVASNGVEALEIANHHQGEIDLLVTDVMMPKMGGRKLVETLRLAYPKMRMLYLSGYSAEAVLEDGALASGTGFLEKPFTLSGLTTKVREVLDANKD